MKLMSDGKTANVATCGVATLIGIKKGLQTKAMERALHNDTAVLPHAGVSYCSKVAESGVHSVLQDDISVIT